MEFRRYRRCSSISFPVVTVDVVYPYSCASLCLAMRVNDSPFIFQNVNNPCATTWCFLLYVHVTLVTFLAPNVVPFSIRVSPIIFSYFLFIFTPPKTSTCKLGFWKSCHEIAIVTRFNQYRITSSCAPNRDMLSTIVTRFCFLQNLLFFLLSLLFKLACELKISWKWH